MIQGSAGITHLTGWPDRDPVGTGVAYTDWVAGNGSRSQWSRVLDGYDEVLLSTYVCHPSVANDNVSGIAVLAVLGRHLAGRPLRRTHRLLFSPGTLGPLAWLSRNLEGLDRVHAGLVVACAGDRGPLRYKRSRRGDAHVDRAAGHVLPHSRPDALVEDFVPWGGDERQFCSPGFDLPIGALTRTPHGLYPEYHSSADDLDLIGAESLGDSVAATLEILDVLERDRTYVSRSPYGEPQLGKRGLYRSVGGGSFEEAALLWVLNLSDGEHDLIAVAERSGLPFGEIARAAELLEQQRDGEEQAQDDEERELKTGVEDEIRVPGEQRDRTEQKRLPRVAKPPAQPRKRAKRAGDPEHTRAAKYEAAAERDGDDAKGKQAGITGFEQTQISPSFPLITISGFTGFNGSGSNSLPKANRIRTSLSIRRCSRFPSSSRGTAMPRASSVRSPSRVRL